jgi:hypothetical protein
MRFKSVWVLAAVNCLLLTTLLMQWFKPTMAYGQAGAAGRASDYIMIPGQIVGGNSSLVYIIDTQNGLLSARTYDGRAIQDKTPAIDLDRVLGRNAGRN